jgi:formate hydrogenlyase transcriptional activator
MERAIQFPAKVLPRERTPQHESRLFSMESVLNLQKLIFAGSPLSEVLTKIAQLVEAQAEGTVLHDLVSRRRRKRTPL